jgi:hypothetical protein
MDYGVTSTPALVIDGVAKSKGKLLNYRIGSRANEWCRLSKHQSF